MDLKNFMIPKKYPVACHTDNLEKGSTFVAIKGFLQDGHNHIEKAIKLGAKRIVLEDKKIKSNSFGNIAKDVEFVYVENSRKALADFSAGAFDFPAKKLKIIGITGTKGKTTTTCIVEYILKSLGFKTALLGTNKNRILDQEVEASRTTPQSDYLHAFFYQCVKHDVEYVVMEVSSHALSLDRVFGIEFDVVCFTNLASEHMDFYKTLDDYFDAKSLLFKQVKKGGAIIINSDDSWGRKAIENLREQKDKLVCFGTNSDFSFGVDENSLSGLKINLNGCGVISSEKLFGKFNSYNLVMSFLVCLKLGLKSEDIKLAIEKFPGVEGRLEVHKLKNGARAFVDYAHNPSSMAAVLESLKPLTKDLIVVFGCGGDRDKTKRPLMGKIAAEYADKIIITDDNPRSEDRKKIALDILEGMQKDERARVLVELDRKVAIKKAAEMSGAKSIVALLGKGHETYYLVNGKKFYLDDFEQISKY